MAILSIYISHFKAVFVRIRCLIDIEELKKVVIFLNFKPNGKVFVLQHMYWFILLSLVS